MWSDPEIETVLPGVHRVPLPLPGDALKAINVYLLEEADGYTLIDSGWDSRRGKEAMREQLAALKVDVGQIRRIYITHLHRDHVGQSTHLSRRSGAEVWIGEGERRGYLGCTEDMPSIAKSQREYLLRAGATELVELMERNVQVPPPADWDLPRHWTTDGETLPGGLTAIATPGHTQGHTSFHDARRGIFLPGDHVLPHITPSIGFEPFPTRTALADFLASLAKVRELEAGLVLPAHGPVFTDLAGRVDELVAHHDKRLDLCLKALRPNGSTALDVATQLPWTRRERNYADLDVFNQVLAVWETLAHLELLVSQERAEPATRNGGGIAAFRPKVCA
ncbi:MAG TPA: MBL fold metallo-hydrolase [Pseudonocardiaceae bacterium]